VVHPVTTTARGPVIADVARLAGVSVPTVSRVLTGAAQVRTDKRDRVLAAIATLNYRPSAAARALASRQSKTVAIVAGNTSKYGYAATIEGLEEAARAHDYTVTITVVESPAVDDVDDAISLVLAQGPAGVAVLKFDPSGVAVLSRLPESLPVVAISGVRSRSVAQAVLDEVSAAEELTTYLLDLGHATVHHVRVPPSRNEDGRTLGWRRTLVKRGATVHPALDATWAPESGRVIGRALAADPAVTAVYCGNDEIAMGVIRGLRDAGLRVPEDVSVVGFDDHPLAAMWSPSLTTARQDFGGLGRRAFGLLLGSMGIADSSRFSSERPELVIRESAGPPAAR
jgi:DNA-binding LacI/PurR family transcriptional regulator